MPSLHDDLIQSLDRFSEAPVNTDLVRLLEEWQAFFGAASNTMDQIQQFAQLVTNLVGLNGRPDPEVELELAKVASQNPVLGPAIVLASLPATTARWTGQFWQGLYVEEVDKRSDHPETDVQLSAPYDSWNIKTLPPPGPGQKYLIFSDVHRDDWADRRNPLEPGSIEHFSRNAALFDRILEHVAKPESGYTILEGGDCEELWFIRSVDGDGRTVEPYPKKPDGSSLDVSAKLASIIQTHRGIYDRLAALHADGRYYRIQGNHDSWVRTRPPHDGTVFKVLEDAMIGATPAPGTPPFRVWDACVIPGVKTMMEHAAGEVLTDAWEVTRGRMKREEFVRRLLTSHLGLDSAVYTEKARMLVAHGHQFDFWNCEQNEIVGLLISNTVATFLDRHIDRIIELRGIAWQGNPLIDFSDFFAGLPVFEGWPEGSAAVARAHSIQHMPNGQRVLSDGVFYYESIPALWAALGIALKEDKPGGVTPAQSRGTLNLSTPTGIKEYLRRHHFHHICIGHTHGPHSQPFFTLANLAALLPPPFSWVVDVLRMVLPDFLEPALKTMYSNSGTGGWMEGVIWATEIDETGQSRLIFWTEKTRVETPERMDWELEPLDPVVRSHLLDAYRAALASPGAELTENLAELIGKLKQRLADLNIAAEALGIALAHSISLPINILAIALLQRAKEFSPERKLDEIEDWLLKKARGVAKKITKRAERFVNEALDQAVDALRDQLDKLQGFTLDVLVSVRRRTLLGFGPGGGGRPDADYFVIRAPISNTAKDSLLRFQGILGAKAAPGETPAAARDRRDAALHHAGIALAVFDGFPRNFPFFSNRAEASNHAARILASDHPVLHALLSTLWTYPVAGQEATVSGVTVWSRFTLEDTTPGPTYVRLTVKLGKAGEPEPPDPDEGRPFANV